MISSRSVSRQLVACWVAGLLAACGGGGGLRVTNGPAPVPSTIDALAIFPVDVRFAAHAGAQFEKTWDLLEGVRRHGGYVAIGPSEFKRRPRAEDEPFRQTTLILAANRLGIDPDGVLVLVGSVAERVQRTSTVIEAASSGQPAGGRLGGRSAVVAEIRVVHPGKRATLLSTRLRLEEDPFSERPDNDMRPTLTSAWRTVVTATLRELALRAHGSDPPRDWGFDVMANPANVLRHDEKYEQLDILDKEVAQDQRLRYFHPTLDDRSRRIFMRSPPGSLLVTAVGGEREGRPPADLAVGDLVTHVGDHPILGAWHLDRVLRFAGPSPELKLTVVRDRETVGLDWKP